MVPPDIILLINHFIDGTSDFKQSDQLRDLLRTREDVRMEYFKRLDLHATILFSQSSISTTPLCPVFSEIEPRVSKHSPTRWPLFAAKMISIVFLCGLLAYWIFSPTYIATITRLDEHVQFEDQHLDLDSRLKLGQEIKLKKGNLALRYDSGAEIIIQSPSVFKLLTKNSLLIDSGQLEAFVNTDEAYGFSVQTPTALLKDYGTRFATKVNKSGKTQINVSSGKVTLAGRGEAGWKIPHQIGVDQSMIAELGKEVRVVQYKIMKTSYPSDWTDGQEKSSLEKLDQAIVQDNPIFYWRATSKDQKNFHTLTEGEMTLKVIALSDHYPNITKGVDTAESSESILLSATDRDFLQTDKNVGSLFEGDFTIELLASTPNVKQHQTILHIHRFDHNFRTNSLIEFVKPSDLKFMNPSSIDPDLTDNFCIRWTHRSPANSGGGLDIFSPLPVKKNHKYRITIVHRNGSSSLYVDGKFVAKSNRQVLPGSQKAKLVLGMHLLRPTGPVREFLGNLYYVALYRTALSDETIRSHAQHAFLAFQKQH